MKIEASQRLRI